MIPLSTFTIEEHSIESLIKVTSVVVGSFGEEDDEGEDDKGGDGEGDDDRGDDDGVYECFFLFILRLR